MSQVTFTRSEASHVANVLANMAEAIDREISQYSVVSRKTTDITSNNTVVTAKQTFNVEASSRISSLIEKKANIYRLSAWLRENIKKLSNQQQDIESESYIAQPFLVGEPEFQEMVDLEWAFDQLNIREQAEYLAVEAQAAAYGKYVHDKGLCNVWLKQISDLKTIERGNFFTITETTCATELNTLHTNLVKKHREYNSRVNYYKAKINNMVNAENQKRISHNKTAQSEWSSARQSWNDQQLVAQKQFEQEKLARLKENASSKIVLPEDLREIYESNKASF